MTASVQSDTCSTREAAALLGISVRTAQLWVEDGRLHAWKTPGGHRRILRQSVDAMLSERRHAGTGPEAVFDILVVEDDAIQQTLYRKRLGNLGTDVRLRTADNGYEGLIRIGEAQPNVLVTDLMMPGIDGFRMLETLRRSPLVRPMQIIVATALDSADIQALGGLPAGITIFHKPVPLAQLVRLVEAYRDIWAIRKNLP